MTNYPDKAYLVGMSKDEPTGYAYFIQGNDYGSGQAMVFLVKEVGLTYKEAKEYLSVLRLQHNEEVVSRHFPNGRITT